MLRRIKKTWEWIQSHECLIISILSLVVTACGIFLAVFIYLSNRSMWVDEAMLAYSFSKRSLWNLIEGVFEHEQSAPVLYLLIVKVLTLVFGNSELVLRMYSLAAYFGTLGLTYVLLKDAFKVKNPLLGVALVSTMHVLLYYASEFKPYMGDCFSVLLVLELYFLFEEKRLKLFTLTLMYALLLWLSYPTIFFIGGVFIYETVRLLCLKNYRKMAQIILFGSLILVSFGFEYILWLKPVANSAYMIEFWKEFSFPLIPTSFSDVYRLLKLSGALIKDMGYALLWVATLIVIGSVVAISRRSHMMKIIVISLFLTLIASFMGKYPFYRRLVLFIQPLFVVAMVIALDYFRTLLKLNIGKLVYLVVVLAALASNYASIGYLSAEARVYPGEEFNGLIAYVDEKITSDEILYVSSGASPTFEYKNGYDHPTIGANLEVSVQNVILGESFYQDVQATSELRKLLVIPKLYVMLANRKPERVEPLITLLNRNGYLELIQNIYDTPLYYHVSNIKDMKTALEIELLEHRLEDGLFTFKIRLSNTGDAIINADKIDEVGFVINHDPMTAVGLPIRNILPKTDHVIEMTMRWDSTQAITSVELYNHGKFWFSEIGVEPIGFS